MYAKIENIDRDLLEEIVLEANIKNNDIILPPTIDEIEKVENIATIKNYDKNYKIKRLIGGGGGIVTDDPGITLTNILSPYPANSCNMYILGKNNQEEIVNGKILSDLLKYSGVTIEYVN